MLVISKFDSMNKAGAGIAIKFGLHVLDRQRLTEKTTLLNVTETLRLHRSRDVNFFHTRKLIVQSPDYHYLIICDITPPLYSGGNYVYNTTCITSEY